MGSVQLLLWVGGVHLVGMLCVAALLLPALRDNNAAPRPRQEGDGDDGWGGHGPKLPPNKPEPPNGGIPLLDAEQSHVRLREAGRLSELLPSRERRPAREPERQPDKAPAGR
jgi:hypothetical protein